jgi:hypothetical protein
VISNYHTKINLKFKRLKSANELKEFDEALEREEEDVLLIHTIKKKLTMGTKDYKQDIEKRNKAVGTIIAKGQAKGNTTGVCDDQIEIVNSSPNELIGYIIIVTLM